MDQQRLKRRAETVSAGHRARWLRPQADRLIAGGAESGGDTSTDGIDILS